MLPTNQKNVKLRVEILDLIEQGWTISQIAQKTGKTRGTIYQYVQDMGKPTYLLPKGPLWDVLVKRWLDKYPDGNWKLDDLDAAIKRAGYKVSKRAIKISLTRHGWGQRWIKLPEAEKPVEPIHAPVPQKTTAGQLAALAAADGRLPDFYAPR